MWGVLTFNTVGSTVGTSHTTVSTPGGYQRFPVISTHPLLMYIDINVDLQPGHEERRLEKVANTEL